MGWPIIAHRDAVKPMPRSEAGDPKASEIRQSLPREDPTQKGTAQSSRPEQQVGVAPRSSMRTTVCPGAKTSFTEQAPLGGYRLVLAHRVGQQLREAPALLQGHLAGITAILRIDPTAPSTMLQIQPTERGVWTATYEDGRGFLQYRVVEAQRLVVLLDWVWIG
jgi:hypothetical protein